MKRICTVCLLLLTLCLLTACGGQEASAPPPPARDAAVAVAESQTYSEEMVEITETRAQALLELEPGSYQELSMFMDASRTTSEMVVVITLADSAQAEAMMATLNSYRDSLLSLYVSYKPEEKPKLDAAEALRNGTQVALIVAPDQQAGRTALQKAWGK